MFYGWFTLLAFVALTSVVTLVEGECSNYRISLAPTPIYNDIKCTPKYSPDEKDCIEEYDCSHIYNRPANTCHFKGKFYKVGERIPDEEMNGVWDRDCRCSESLEFTCNTPLDGCAESWVGGYPKYGCYLKYEFDRYCASGEVCPPFEGNAECEVKGVKYKEGQKFNHPDKKCVKCICGKGFDGKLEEPFCQLLNCTAELRHSKAIDDSCAPFYHASNREQCCPDSWICPTENVDYRPNPLSPGDTKLHCKYGTKSMATGETGLQTDAELGDVTCECALPPFPHCTAYPKQLVPLP